MLKGTCLVKRWCDTCTFYCVCVCVCVFFISTDRAPTLYLDVIVKTRTDNFDRNWDCFRICYESRAKLYSIRVFFSPFFKTRNMKVTELVPVLNALQP